jgi:hypothetical protein
MKKAFLASLIAASVFALSACGGQAHAAGMPPAPSAGSIFVAQDGNIYSIYNLRKITTSATGFQLTYSDGTLGSPVYDPTGALFAKVKTLPDFGPFVNLGGGVWLNTDMASEIVCSGNVDIIAWRNSGAEYINDNGCAFFASLKAVTPQ